MIISMDEVSGSGDIYVRPFEPADHRCVVDLILSIQSEEFGIAITEADQPDLAGIADFYQSGQGNFWVAVAPNDAIVGTIGLRDIGGDLSALRKMFVHSDWRGRDGVAAKLLDALLRGAHEAGVRQIWLGTTDRFLAAHRFYEKHGFSLVDEQQLPGSFPRMTVDSRFYRRIL